MDVERSETISASDGSMGVRIDTLPEHHMGACTVYLTPTRPVAGISRFQTTNGTAFFVDPGPLLILGDACVILIYRPAVDDVHFVERPKGWYFANVRVEDGWLYSDLYARAGRRQLPAISLNELERCRQGLDSWRAGDFPALGHRRFANLLLNVGQLSAQRRFYWLAANS